MPARATITVVSAVADVGTTTEATLTSNYTEVEVVAYVDLSSDNQWFYETIPLGDVRFNAVEKNLTDTATLTDEIPITFEKPTTETLAFAETFAKVVSYNRSFTDAFTLDDLSQIDKDFYGNKGNIFGFTDIVGLTHNKNLTDNYSVGDVFAKVIEFYRDFSETLNLSEEREFEVLKAEEDSVNMGSLPALGVSLLKEDTYTVGDTSFNSLIKNLVDAFTLDDSALVNKDFFGSKGNVLGFSEIFVRAVDFIREYTDSVAILDSPSVEPLLQKEDSVSFSEVVLVGWIYERVINDLLRVHDQTPSALGSGALNTLGLNTIEDNVRAFIDPGVAEGLGFSDIQTSSINKTINDIFSLDDALLVDKDYFGHKGNAFGFSEVISKTLVFVRAFVDNTNLSDTTNISAQKAIADNTLFSDTTLLSPSKGVDETLLLSEVRGMQLSKALTDAFALDDAALINKNYSGNKGNIFGVSDVFDRSVMYARSFQETVSTSDTNKVIFTAGKSDSVSISDILEFNTEYNRNFTDTAVLDSVSLLALGKAFTDTINSVTDVYAITQMKNPSDTIDFTDSTRATIEKDVIDGIGLDDSTLVNKNYFGNKGNLIGLSELVSLVTTYKRTISDSVALSETLDTAFNKNETENITLNELTAFVHSKGLTDSAIVVDSSSVSLNKSKTDSFGMSDNNVVASGVNPSDSISFSDSHDRTLSKVLSDTFALDDSALINKDFTGSKGNVFGFSDVLSKTVGFNRAFTDAFSFSDDSVRSLNKGINDSSVLNDLLSFSQTKKISEILTFNDDYGVQLEKTLSDSFTLDDSALVNKDYFGNKGNIVGISDQVTVDYYYGGLVGQRPLNTMSFN